MEIQIFGELNALSRMVDNLYAMGFIQSDNPIAAATKLGAEMERRIGEKTAPGPYMDAVSSDALVGEARDALSRHFAEIVKRLEEHAAAQARG